MKNYCKNCDKLWQINTGHSCPQCNTKMIDPMYQCDSCGKMVDSLDSVVICGIEGDFCEECQNG